MPADALSVVLVSASPATTDLVRKACANSDGTAFQFACVADTDAARSMVLNMDNVVVVLDAESGSKPLAASLRAFAKSKALAPVIVVTRDFSTTLEREVTEGGATDLLPLEELNYSMLRRA